jgi:serine protease Do
MRGDVIRSFNGQPVSDTNGLRNRIAALAPGTDATLVVVRDGSERTLRVKLDEATATAQGRNQPGAPSTDNTALGVSVAPLTPEAAAQAGLPRDTRGLLVQSVNPDSRAASAGIQTGDAIVEVNRSPVSNVEDLRAALKASANRPVLLLINRNGQNMFVTVRPS